MSSQNITALTTQVDKSKKFNSFFDFDQVGINGRIKDKEKQNLIICIFDTIYILFLNADET